MTRWRSLGLAAVALLAGAAAASGTARAEGESGAILPGWWEYTSNVLGGLQSKTDRWCVKPEEVDRIVAGPSNRHYRCTYPVREVGGGRIRLEGVCISKHGREVPVTASGAYTPTSFKLSGTARPFGVPVPASIRAHRLAEACPAPSAKP